MFVFHLAQILPRMAPEQFTLVSQYLDIMLDPFPFGSGITAIEALAVATPLVTLISNDLRGAIATTLYRTMGYTDLIASSVDDYIRCVGRLIRSQRQRDTARLRLRLGSRRIFQAKDAVHEWTRLLLQIARDKGILSYRLVASAPDDAHEDEREQSIVANTTRTTASALVRAQVNAELIHDESSRTIHSKLSNNFPSPVGSLLPSWSRISAVMTRELARPFSYPSDRRELPLSSVACESSPHGPDFQTCVFYNMVFFNSQVHYVIDDESDLPAVVVNGLRERKGDSIQLVNYDGEAGATVDMSGYWRPAVLIRNSVDGQRILKIATWLQRPLIIWLRFLPNAYGHHLWEDMLPIVRMACLYAGEDCGDDKPFSKFLSQIYFQDSTSIFVCCSDTFFSMHHFNVFSFIFILLPSDVFATGFGKEHYAAHFDTLFLHQPWLNGSKTFPHPPWLQNTDTQQGNTYLVEKVVVGGGGVCGCAVICHQPFEWGFADWLRDRLFQVLLSDHERTAPTVPRRALLIYRTLGKSRLFTNLEPTVDALTQEGYSIVARNLEGVSLREQAVLFHSYDTVIGIHGAALANVLFMRPNAILVDVRTPGLLPNDHPFPLEQASCFSNTSILSVLVDYARIETQWSWIESHPHDPAAWTSLSPAEQDDFRRTHKCPSSVNQRTCVVLWLLYGSNVQLVPSDIRHMLQAAAAQRARGERFSTAMFSEHGVLLLLNSSLESNRTLNHVHINFSVSSPIDDAATLPESPFAASAASNWRQISPEMAVTLAPPARSLPNDDPELPLSSVTCDGSTHGPDFQSCVFHNTVLYLSQVYYIVNDENSVPSVVVNGLRQRRGETNVQLKSSDGALGPITDLSGLWKPVLLLRNSAQGRQIRRLATWLPHPLIVWPRLMPSAYGHHLWEDILPIIRLTCLYAGENCTDDQPFRKFSVQIYFDDGRIFSSNIICSLIYIVSF
jgi:hypothetical protein